MTTDDLDLDPDVTGDLVFLISQAFITLASLSNRRIQKQTILYASHYSIYTIAYYIFHATLLHIFQELLQSFNHSSIYFTTQPHQHYPLCFNLLSKLVIHFTSPLIQNHLHNFCSLYAIFLLFQHKMHQSYPRLPHTSDTVLRDSNHLEFLVFISKHCSWFLKSQGTFIFCDIILLVPVQKFMYLHLILLLNQSLLSHYFTLKIFSVFLIAFLQTHSGYL